jgi:glucosylceramidase
VRIASNSVAGGIENVAFRNPDGSKVLVALNSAAPITFKVQWGSQSLQLQPAGSAATIMGGTVTTFTPTVTTSGSLSASAPPLVSPSAAQTYTVSGGFERVR